ncbi:glycoside hydrolase family 1 protein [Vallitalea maricola]|uniref:Glycoside hydrolase family 1 protein n=1 Tax=Vallitalea maricola TaxID=3074433 RepID=A0ACB5UH73_9FIRM|nr:glycoside hydrolase family 1 protein [Vallitalea sp. AN17-2]
MDKMNTTSFPKNFLWGAGASAFQAEGAYNEDGKGLTSADLHSFLKSDIQADTKIAVDFYHKYEEDIRLMKELGLNSFRFSISWARIFPNGNDSNANELGVAFYDKVIDLLVKYNIEPIVTLYHFDIPQNLVEVYNGWASRKCIDDYERYVHYCFKRYGDRVKYWITVNEQRVIAESKSLVGFKEKEGCSWEAIRHQMNHHLYLANARAIKLCHKILPDVKIGTAVSYLTTYPATSKPEDVFAAKELEDIWSFATMDVYYYGDYPDYYKAYMKEQEISIQIEESDYETLRNAKPDFIGVNWYQTATIEYNKFRVKEEKKDQIEPTTMGLGGRVKIVKNPNLTYTKWGWPIDPKGFRLALRKVYERYHLPIIVTENGLGAADSLTKDNKIHDEYRIDFLKHHLLSIKKAIEDGVVVIAYSYWSFIDILSSSNGMNKRYGFVYVDRDEFNIKDLKRIKKDSYYCYQNIIKDNGSNLE